MENNKDETKNESLFQDFAESLKNLKIPEGLRESNRRYIEKALHSKAYENRASKNWWKKRVSIPLPIAAGFLLLICLQLALQFTNLKSYFTVSQTAISDKRQSSIGLSDKTVEPYYSEHGVYVAGIGFIEKSKTYDYFKENDYENKL